MQATPDESVSVLLISSQAADVELISRLAAEIEAPHIVLEHCQTFDEAKRHIDAHNYDMYLISSQLGERSGIDLIRLTDPEKHHEPFIVLANARDEQAEKQAITLGASDYLVASRLDADLLSRSLNYSLGRRRAEAQRLQHLIELNQAKDEFISVASHQLRTPATSVKQYIGILLEGIAGEVTGEQKAILQKAYDSNERQLKIVSDLLKVARIDAGKVILNQSRIDINQLVTEAVREQAEIAKGRQQTIRFTPSDTAAEAWVDTETLRMVVDNLIDNGRKYSYEGAAVQVSVVNQPTVVVIAVADQGVGIESADMGKLFEKFSRIHNSLSDQTEGSGLGLYWVKKIVDLHGGSITVDSTPGKGTTFSINLPKPL